MLNRIIGFSLKNRILVLIITGLILVVGTIVTVNSEVDVFPDLNAPTVVVMTEARGYAPEEIEKTVIFPIETAVNGATGVRRVRSSATTGFAVVWVEFDWGMDIYRARQIVSEKLSTIEGQLPENVDSPVLGPQSSILGEMLIIGLTSDSIPLLDVRTYADKILRPQILGIGGVSQVTVMGGDIREYQIQIDLEKMKHYGVSLSEMLNAASNINTNVGGGTIYEYGNEYIVKGEISTSNVDDIGLAVVRSDENGIVLIRDVAEVKIGEKLPKLGVASKDDKPAVLLTVTKQPNVDTNSLTDDIEAELSEIKKTIPDGMNVYTDIFKQADFINNSISNIQRSLIEGAIFVIVVLFFFLMNTRTTVISLVALPLSVIITVVILHLFGYTLNTMSLGGIAIAMGALVDDAIVDVENVYKRLRANKLLPDGERQSTLDVVFHSSAEVRMPIFNSSLIIIASFLPLFFLSGIEGRLLIPLGISFIVALLASTLVALTVTPVLCSYLLGSTDKAIGNDPRLVVMLKSHYGNGLKWCLSHRNLTLGIVGALFVVSGICFTTLGRSFLPSFNEGSFTINVATVPGVSLDVSNRIGQEAERAIMSVPEIKTVARKTGRAELDEHSRGVNASEFEAPYEIVDRPRSEIMKELREKLTAIPGTNIEIGQPISHRIDAMLSGSQSQIAIKLFGSDLNQLYRTGSQIKNLISEIPGIVDVNIEQQVSRPELSITPRRDMLARYGITINDFSEFINVVLSGEVVSQVYENGYPFDITVKADHSMVNKIDRIKSLMIDSNQGKIPLEYVADVRSSEGPNSINRENVSRRIVVSANVSNSDLRGAVKSIQKAINDNVELPEGYYVSYGGQFESEETASRTLAAASILALLIIVILLYQEFKDVKESLIILVNLPLAMIGGVLILVLTGRELNIPAIIGFISLLGITTRNGMLLISRYNHLKSEGLELHDIIFRGSVDRLNPILMTAFTTALALIPLAVNSTAPGNEIQSPMAIVILGGLLSSTVLNVFIVPVLYYFINKKDSKR
ncbi:MAG: efflux RND transporter permease subunit [Muribaculaceae bacterium]|nr:efflux RND transporter permease subunit [Muribaculaceae bacterium]